MGTARASLAPGEAYERTQRPDRAQTAYRAALESAERAGLAALASRAQEALERLLEGRTAVIVAHRLSTIQNAARIMLVHDGEVAESGTHDELIALNGRYAKLHRLQFEFGAVSAPTGGGK